MHCACNAGVLEACRAAVACCMLFHKTAPSKTAYHSTPCAESSSHLSLVPFDARTASAVCSPWTHRTPSLLSVTKCLVGARVSLSALVQSHTHVECPCNVPQLRGLRLRFFPDSGMLSPNLNKTGFTQYRRSLIVRLPSSSGHRDIVRNLLFRRRSSPAQALAHWVYQMQRLSG